MARYSFEDERITAQVSVDRMRLVHLDSLANGKFIQEERLRVARAALNPIFDENLRIARNLAPESAGPESFFQTESGIMVIPQAHPLIQFGKLYYDKHGLVQEVSERDTTIRLGRGISFIFDTFSILPHSRGGKAATQLAGYGYLGGTESVRSYQKILLSPQDRHVFACMDTADCLDIQQLSRSEFDTVLANIGWM